MKKFNVLFIALCLWLAFLLGIEFLIHKHLYFSWEEWPGFYAAFGFVAFVILIIAAKYILRPIIKRKENYYD